MSMMRHFLLLGALLVAAWPVLAADKVHRLVLQVSDDSPEKMNTALNNAANVARYYTGKGQDVEIRIVAFSGGLNMLRTDKSPVADKLKSTAESLPNLTFEACQNTIDGMAKRENKKPDEIPLFPGVKVVPAGVVELLELGEQGWTIVRP
jgi:intracellular sulfur oxidation DsrE/DsrF family protein